MKFRKMMGVTAAFLCAALALSGCGSTGETAYRIGIVQQDEHSSLDAATQGFEDKLMELLGEENITFDYQNAQGRTGKQHHHCYEICFRWLRFDSGKRHNGFAVSASGNGGYPYRGYIRNGLYRGRCSEFQ
mgnify:CR=1 FL=1